MGLYGLSEPIGENQLCRPWGLGGAVFGGRSCLILFHCFNFIPREIFALGTNKM